MQEAFITLMGYMLGFISGPFSLIQRFERPSCRPADLQTIARGNTIRKKLIKRRCDEASEICGLLRGLLRC